MKEFILTYWREILSLICFIASIILCCVRKKPVKVVDTLRETILRLLPGCINAAEIESGLTAEKKKAFCVSCLQNVLRDLGYGDDVVGQYLPFIYDQIEVILSTPQKKVR